MINNKLKVLAGVIAFGAGFASYAMGWWELPKRVDDVEDKIETTDKKLDKYIDASAANLEAQKQLNVVQNAFYQQQLQQQADWYKKVSEESN